MFIEFSNSLHHLHPYILITIWNHCPCGSSSLTSLLLEIGPPPLPSLVLQVSCGFGWWGGEVSPITLLLDKQLILSSLMSMSLPVFGRFDFFSIFAGTARIINDFPHPGCQSKVKVCWWSHGYDLPGAHWTYSWGDTVKTPWHRNYNRSIESLTKTPVGSRMKMIVSVWGPKTRKRSK